MSTTTYIHHQLSLQRCRQYIAQIHALIYMGTPRRGKARAGFESVHDLLSLLEHEIQESAYLPTVTDSAHTSNSDCAKNAQSPCKNKLGNIHPFPGIARKKSEVT